MQLFSQKVSFKRNKPVLLYQTVQTKWTWGEWHFEEVKNNKDISSLMDFEVALIKVKDRLIPNVL